VKNLDDALNYAGKAININPSYYKAYVHRAAVHGAKEMYDEAVRDYEVSFSIQCI
jgi:Tfp pilus assembly protein PilF